MVSTQKTPYDAWIAQRVCPDGEQFSAQALQRYQLARLNEVISTARKCSPFYKRHFQGYGAFPLTSLADLGRLPFMGPEDVRREGLKMLCVHQGEISRVVTLETSGTTGQPKQVYFTEEDQALTVDMFAQSMSQIVDVGEPVSILLPAARPGGVGDLLYRALLALRTRPERYGLISSLPDMLHKLISRRASCLVGVPVQVLALAKYCEMRQESSSVALKNVLLCTDYVSMAATREIERIWGCQVFDYYGMTEAGLGGGMECPARCGYHLHEADLYFEVVDPASGRPVKEGQEGEVVISTLTRRGMPLIRYRTGDISRFVPGQCTCGTVLQRLEKVRFRQSGMVFIDGCGGFAMADIDEVLLALPGVINFSADMTREGDKAALKIGLLTLWHHVDEDQIRNALSSIPCISAALPSGRLDIVVTAREVSNSIEPSAAKRQVGIFFK